MMCRFVVFFGLVMLVGCLAADEAHCENFAGSLSSADGGIEGVGDWVEAGTTVLSWVITDMDTYYHYEYTLNVAGDDKEISHFIIEVSDTFGSGSFWDTTGTFASTEINDFDDTNGNPNIPGVVHGLKFDETSGMTLTIGFDSNRQPVWGDFYAKNGGQLTNQVWNAGFLTPDPADPPSDGTISNHLLVPDTVSVPEPTTVSLLLAGLLNLVFVVVRRRKRCQDGNDQ